MRNKNTMEYGEVHEEVTLSVEYSTSEWKNSLHTESKVTKTVTLKKNCLNGSDGLCIGNILDFQMKANALLREVEELLVDGTFVRVSLTKSAYEHVPEYTITDELGTHTCTLKQLLFERWAFEGDALDTDPDDEGAGLYLCPDTRYTDATWDMILYWNQDILMSLAEGHL